MKCRELWHVVKDYLSLTRKNQFFIYHNFSLVVNYYYHSSSSIVANRTLPILGSRITTGSALRSEKERDGRAIAEVIYVVSLLLGNTLIITHCYNRTLILFLVAPI